MKETCIFEQYDFYRGLTVELLDSVASEEQADVIPKGHRNSLRWNLGHVPVLQEWAMFHYGKDQPGSISSKVYESFKPDTSPKDWSSLPLTLNEIRELLLEQKERIKETFSGKLEDSLLHTFDLLGRKIEKVGDLFVFTLWHEGLHQGVMQSMEFALK